MHNKLQVLANQRQINAFISYQSVDNNELDNLTFSYKSQLLSLRKKCYKALGKEQLKIQEYTQTMDLLVEQLHLLSLEKESTKKAIQSLRLTLLHFIAEINSKLIAAIKDEDEVQKNHLHSVFKYQEDIEDTIKTYFDAHFFLSKPVTFSNIRQKYEQAYEKEHGSGCLGFFKLPLKRMFQQKTRELELNFLEHIEEYCEKQTDLPEQFKTSFKLSASSLVTRHIATETYGAGSLLAKILQNYIQHPIQDDNSSISLTSFINECQNRQIQIPQHLGPNSASPLGFLQEDSSTIPTVHPLA